MSLIDDTCDGCGDRYDPMGDPALKRDSTPEEPWRVLCARCALNAYDTPLPCCIGNGKCQAPPDIGHCHPTRHQRWSAT